MSPRWLDVDTLTDEQIMHALGLDKPIASYVPIHVDCANIRASLGELAEHAAARPAAHQAALEAALKADYFGGPIDLVERDAELARVAIAAYVAARPVPDGNIFTHGPPKRITIRRQDDGLTSLVCAHCGYGHEPFDEKMARSQAKAAALAVSALEGPPPSAAAIRNAALEEAALIADEHWPESGHVPLNERLGDKAISCAMSISVMIRRLKRVDFGATEKAT